MPAEQFSDPTTPPGPSATPPPPSDSMHSPTPHTPSTPDEHPTPGNAPARTVEPFRRVSSKLIGARLVVLMLVMVPLLVALVAFVTILDADPTLTLSLLVGWVVVLIWLAVVIVRQVPAMGYQCRTDDLLVERGIMLRRSTLVPYGRMQFVEVTHGPIARMFGLAAVELHTAAALSQASIEGLPRAEAEALRDHLAARGESDLAGL